MTTFIVVLVITFCASFAISINNIRAKENLALIHSSLAILEKHPTTLNYQSFLKNFEKCTRLQKKDVFEPRGIYYKLLYLMYQNRTNLLAYDTVKQLFKRFKFNSSENLRERVYNDLISTIQMILETTPVNWIIYLKIMETLSECILRFEETQRVYDSSLLVLEKNPNNDVAKQFVLMVGRWHFSNSRMNKILTFYDEMVIRNDINLRVN